MSSFHLAFNVGDPGGARAFHGHLPEGGEGRPTRSRVDLDLSGRRISLPLGAPLAQAPAGKVGDRMRPVPHCRVLLEMRVRGAPVGRPEAAGQDVAIGPAMRVEGQPSEHATMLHLDPCGNPLEFEGMRERAALAFAA